MLRIPLRFMRKVFTNRESPWAKKDHDEAISIHAEDQIDPLYRKLNYQWRHALELKQNYRERRLEREKSLEKIPEQESKLVVHSFAPSPTVVLPRDDQLFAVLKISGLQHKVTKDDTVIIDKLPYDIGTQIVFDTVMLIGTPLYTVIGRPVIGEARVYASVEQQTLL